MNISFCSVVLSLIQGIALNTDVPPCSQGWGVTEAWGSGQFRRTGGGRAGARRRRVTRGAPASGEQGRAGGGGSGARRWWGSRGARFQRRESLRPSMGESAQPSVGKQLVQAEGEGRGRQQGGGAPHGRRPVEHGAQWGWVGMVGGWRRWGRVVFF
jgi:hypothetical protein